MQGQSGLDLRERSSETSGAWGPLSHDPLAVNHAKGRSGMRSWHLVDGAYRAARGGGDEVAGCGANPALQQVRPPEPSVDSSCTTEVHPGAGGGSY
jgi:hypothetical protein